MFNRLAEKYFRTKTQDIFLLHPEQLLRMIEAVWSAAPTQVEVGLPLESGSRPSLPSLLKYRVTDLLNGPQTGPTNPGIQARYDDLAVDFPNKLAAEPPTSSNTGRIDWNHLIYAYMLENTRMVQIFHRVLYAYAHGEDLGAPTPTTMAWLRNTEALFYRHLPGTFMMNIRSEIRPDPEAMRRNAYYRMFGMDLSHGTLDNKTYAFHKPSHSNREFVKVFEKLLYEIHMGLINRKNSSGVNTTDYASMVNQFKALANMLELRRQGGNLSREEFNACTLMSWLHLTLEQKDFSLMADLGARANSAEDRLIKIGKKVGMPANTHSGNFIELGSLMSHFLLLVEDKTYEDVLTVRNLFESTDPNNYFPPLMTKIVTQWSIATGRDIKAQAVRPALVLR